MNIIITLPINLVAEIAEGRKQVEIRKSYPNYFYPSKDVVWVKTKGEDKVSLCFTVSHFGASKDMADVWIRYHKKIGVPYAWYSSYVQNAKLIYIWHIQRVSIFTPNLSFSDTFKGITAPQQYCYTAVQLSDIEAHDNKQTARKIQE